jgi:hypothetical protein
MTVADARGRKWDAAAGIGFTVLAFVGFLLPGTPPKADDSAAKLATFFGDHRKEIIVGNFVLGVAGLFFLWFLGSLRSYLRAAEGGEGRLSSASFGGGVAGIALLMAGAGVLNGVAFDLAKSSGASADVVRAVFDASGALFAMSGLAFAAFFGAASCSGARSGALPSWAYWWGAGAAVLQLVAGVSLFVTSGALAAGGVLAGVLFPAVGITWVLAVSIVLMRQDGVPPEVRAEP